MVLEVLEVVVWIKFLGFFLKHVAEYVICSDELGIIYTTIYFFFSIRNQANEFVSGRIQT